jgi:uncharacterized protein (TIGR03066 family)
MGCFAVLALSCGLTFAGQAKLDGKLLIGKWEPVVEKPKDPKDKEKKAAPGPAGPSMTVEFEAGGKMTLNVSDTGKDLLVPGTYKLEGDKLTVEMKLGDKDVKETLLIKKLTDSELVTEDSKKQVETLRRKK